ncbi:LysR family transcriptional regulator [Phaeobacter piscinae]|uniref:LysR family transcriptional regulator n=1 Tax=Phaeobacter piscinae TaxID=1580596 RepID=UPI000BBE809B|nr:LysR family transcriptional regulator [Phaeobacter piscinae]ATG40681.1 HTH-type transcriptional regulator, lysR family [Phaeobacter piscinae]
MIEIGAIPVFVAVAETGGFAAAARQLGITKSAVSKRIGNLEAHLGMQLFHRSTRSMSLTEAGEIYLSHAVQALGSAREAEDAVTAMRGQPAGRLRVNAPMSFGWLHVAPLIKDFLEHHPGITLDLTMDDRVADLVEAGFDMAIRAGTLPDSALIARRLAPIHSVLAAAPEYLAQAGTPKHPEDLLHHSCLHYSYSRDPREWLLHGAEGEIRVRTKGRLRVNNSEALCTALIDGLGIGRLPTFVAGAHLAAGRLVQVLPAYALPEQSLYAVFPERRHMPAKVRAFADFLADRIGRETPFWDIEAGLGG